MVAEMVEKPLTEAQRLIARLEGEFGMASAAIAREIKVKSDTVSDIKRRKSTGNLQLYRLRRLLSVMETGGVGEESAATATQPLLAPIVPDFSDVTAGDDPASLTLNGEEPPAAAAKPLREKASDLLNSFFTPSSDGAAPRKKSKSESDEQAGLIEQLVPLAALLLVSSCALLIPDPYKQVGPNHGEASAIVYPIIKRAVRELDARKKLSEGTQDAIIVLLAVAAYGQRARGTYKLIHAEEVQRARSDNGASADPAAANSIAGGFTGPTAVPSAADSARRAVTRAGAAATGVAARPERNARRDGAQHGGAGSGDERRSNALLDDLLAADASGRARLGLG